MISRDNLEQQLQRLHFNPHGWGKAEVNQLCDVLMPGEEIDECVNGFYESGFALLVATHDRILLIDHKPLFSLTVEDVRFDMINEFDYAQHFMGAEVKICTGMKVMNFRSWNKTRLRRLLSFVQYRMTEIKKTQQNHLEAQRMHLEQMSQHLQMFYLALHEKYGPVTAGMPTPIDQSEAPKNVPEPGYLPSGAVRPVSAGNDVNPGHFVVSAMKKVVPLVVAYSRVHWVPKIARTSRASSSSTFGNSFATR